MRVINVYSHRRRINGYRACKLDEWFFLTLAQHGEVTSDTMRAIADQTRKKPFTASGIRKLFSRWKWRGLVRVTYGPDRRAIARPNGHIRFPDAARSRRNGTAEVALGTAPLVEGTGAGRSGTAPISSGTDRIPTVTAPFQNTENPLIAHPDRVSSSVPSRSGCCAVPLIQGLIRQLALAAGVAVVPEQGVPAGGAAGADSG